MKTVELNMNEICKRLNEVKQVRKLSNNEIAEAAKTSAQTINTILRGEVKKPNMSILTNISMNLQVNLNWLLYGDGQGVNILPVGSTNVVENPNIRGVDSSMIQELYKMAVERIEDLKKDIENRDYTIKLQRNIMQSNGLNFKLVVVKNPTVGRKARLGRLVILKRNDDSHSEEILHLQTA